MARVIYSPLITSMSGKIGDAVMSRWKGIDYVRSRVIPANPQTALQTAQREALADTLTMWQSVKSWAKTPWDLSATGYAWSGYNRYMDYNIMLVKAGTAGLLTPYNADYINISGPNAAAGGAGVITCTWTAGAGSWPPHNMKFFYRKTESGSEVYAWSAHNSCDPDAETYAMDGLDTGEEYEIAFFCTNTTLNVYQQSYNEVLLAG